MIEAVLAAGFVGVAVVGFLVGRHYEWRKWYFDTTGLIDDGLSDEERRRRRDVSTCNEAADLLMRIVDALDTRDPDPGTPVLPEHLERDDPFKNLCITVASRLQRLGRRLEVA